MHLREFFFGWREQLWRQMDCQTFRKEMLVIWGIMEIISEKKTSFEVFSEECYRLILDVCLLNGKLCNLPHTVRNIAMNWSTTYCRMNRRLWHRTNICVVSSLPLLLFIILQYFLLQRFLPSSPPFSSRSSFPAHFSLSFAQNCLTFCLPLGLLGGGGAITSILPRRHPRRHVFKPPLHAPDDSFSVRSVYVTIAVLGIPLCIEQDSPPFFCSA